jgi:hypothetical protein
VRRRSEGGVDAFVEFAGLRSTALSAVREAYPFSAWPLRVRVWHNRLVIVINLILDLRL